MSWDVTDFGSLALPTPVGSGLGTALLISQPTVLPRALPVAVVLESHGSPGSVIVRCPALVPVRSGCYAHRRWESGPESSISPGPEPVGCLGSARGLAVVVPIRDVQVLRYVRTGWRLAWRVAKNDNSTRRLALVTDRTFPRMLVVGGRADLSTVLIV